MNLLAARKKRSKLIPDNQLQRGRKETGLNAVSPVPVCIPV